MKKKNIGICAMTLLIAGLLIAVSATASVQEQSEEIRTINWNRTEMSISNVQVSHVTPAKEIIRSNGFGGDWLNFVVSTFFIFPFFSSLILLNIPSAILLSKILSFSCQASISPWFTFPFKEIIQ